MRILQCVLFLLLLAPLGAHADGHDPEETRLRPRWQALDTNGDGRVALDELPAPIGAYMRRSDLDGDGTLSLAEYVSFDHDPAGAGRVPLPDNVRLIPDLPYAGTEDPRQRVDVFLPKQPSAQGPLPVIAYIHGGGWSTGSRVMARTQVVPHVASGRYAAVSIGYRLSWQDPWPAQIHDVKAGIRWIRAHAQEYGLDESRICAMGPSAGGHLAAVAGTTNGVAAVEGTLGEHSDQSSDVQCAIDFFGPTDLTRSEQQQAGGAQSASVSLLGGHPKRAREASPLYHVDAADPPFLIVHGTSDPLVPYADSVNLERALREAGVPVILQTIEGGGHGDFAGPEIDRRVRAFLERSFYDPDVDVPHDTIVFTRPGA